MVLSLQFVPELRADEEWFARDHLIKLSLLERNGVSKAVEKTVVAVGRVDADGVETDVAMGKIFAVEEAESLEGLRSELKELPAGEASATLLAIFLLRRQVERRQLVEAAAAVVSGAEGGVNLRLIALEDEEVGVVQRGAEFEFLNIFQRLGLCIDSLFLGENHVVFGVMLVKDDLAERGVGHPFEKLKLCLFFPSLGQIRVG